MPPRRRTAARRWSAPASPALWAAVVLALVGVVLGAPSESDDGAGGSDLVEEPPWLAPDDGSPDILGPPWQSRRLAGELTDLPADQADLTFTIGTEPGAAQHQVLRVVAGVNYSALTIEASGTTFSSALSATAALRLVIEATRADLGSCASAQNVRPGGLGFAASTLGLDVDAAGRLRSEGLSLTFASGGYFRFCFSKDGLFGIGGSAQILEAPRGIEVSGARSACAGDNCFAELAWYCYVYQDAVAPAQSCVVRFDGVDFVDDRSLALLSWGPAVVDAGGPWGCGGEPSERIVGNTSEQIESSVGREFALQAEAWAGGGFSVQACYCPALDGDDYGTEPCDDPSEFVQPVGRIYFFYTKICEGPLCGQVFRATSVVPGSPFAVHLDCGGVAACATSSDNRLRVIDRSPVGLNDLPAWSPVAGCRSSPASSAYWGPAGAGGGARAAYKLFDGISMAPHYVSGVAVSRYFDLCYCDSGCAATDGSAMFRKVGRVRLSPVRLARFRESGGESALRMAGVFGDVMVEGGTNVPVTPLPAQMKIMWDRGRSKTSADCAGLTDVVEFAPGEGPRCFSANECSYRASTMESDPPDPLFQGTGAVVHFNDAGTQGERVRFSEVGVVAICFCGRLADGSGAQPSGHCLQDAERSYWALLSRSMIRGPCVPGSGGVCAEHMWSFCTGVAFRLELGGIGLESTDKLRIVPSDATCRGSPDGGGEPTVLKGCPTACSPLNIANTYLYGGAAGKDDIDAFVTTSESVSCDVDMRGCSTVRLLEILPANDHVIWRFSEDPLLDDGDIVVLDSVTGGSEEENAIIAGHIGVDPIGWPVQRTDNPFRLRVPTSLGSTNPPRFVPGGGWRRTNRARTKEELKATAPKADLQVCWGSGPDAYHARAGRISFQDPSPMLAAAVFLTSFQGGAVAPAIIEFQTSSGGDAAVKYKTAQGPMQLRLAFEDVARLEPRHADAVAQPINASVPGDRDESGDARLFVCGGLFLELWSGDGKGFPMPRGCYYKALLQNRREFHIVFDEKSGLEAGAKYQVVMNMRVAQEASTADRLLSVLSMDDVLLHPYGVVELGDARISRNPVLESGVGEPRFMTSGGFAILDESGDGRDLVELRTDPFSLLFRLRGDAKSPISAGSVLRIFMWPLTVWDLGPACQAACVPHNTKRCGVVQSCAAEAAALDGRRNVVRLQLPQEMDDIYGTTVQHTVRVTELSLPKLGFFGTRVAAQVSLPDDARAHYAESSGAFLWKAPREGEAPATLASLVALEGDGNAMPFRGDEGNSLYVRLALGATLFAELKDDDAALTLALPAGYACRSTRLAPSSLAVLGDQLPQGRGGLRPPSGAGDGGVWVFVSGTCEFRLKAGEVVPAGSRLMLQLSVDNPQQPLQRADVLNRWSVLLRSKGWYRRSAQHASPTPFVDSAALGATLGHYSTNLAVQGMMSYSALQPSSFKAGFDSNWLQLFFRPEQRSGYGASVRVAGPTGFNFATVVPDTCQVSPLSGTSYRVARGVRHTNYLPIVSSCISDCSMLWACPDSTFNRAKIAIKNALLPENVYGFRVKVINRPSYVEGDELAWSISTVDSSGFPLDGTRPSVPTNPTVGSTSKAWGVYQEAGDASRVELAFSSLRPTTSLDALASLTVFPIELRSTIDASCRFIAPSGYSMSPVDFIFHYASVAGATASWPGQEPWQSLLANPRHTSVHGDQAINVLLWDAATYRAGERYGFITKVSLPALPVATSSAAFLLEFGWDRKTLAERPLAYVLPAPQVRAIVNFTVGYQSNVVGVRQLLRVVLETVTEVPIGGELRVQAPLGFVFEEWCSLESIPGEPPAPRAVQCRARPGMTPSGETSGTAISVLPSTAPLASGRVAFAMLARNPPKPLTNRGGQQTSCGYEQCWVAEAFDANGAPTDAAGVARGFAVNAAMPEAKLVNLNQFQRIATGRNDRPRRPNDLIFSFTLSDRVASVGDLILSGPYGFAFEEDCLPGLRFADSPQDPDRGVFGALEWLPAYARWEATAAVRSCLAEGSVARLQIELGLRGGRPYAFRIHATANPTTTAETNLWTIEYAGESSMPFQGFSLWTFSEYALTPRTTAQASDASMIPNPVTLRFRPHKEVRAGAGVGGLLRLLAPEGFEAISAVSVGGGCATYSLVAAPPSTAPGAGSAFRPGQDVKCTIDEGSRNTITFALIGSRMLEAGKLYTLVAQFYNPRAVSSVAAPWIAETFGDPSGASEAALDATTIPGFLINPQALRWEVAPPAGEQHAGALVDGLGLRMAFSEAVGADGGGEVHIRAPTGFDLSAPKRCDPQYGQIFGGAVHRIGITASLSECAAKAWEKRPESDAAQWSSLTLVCNAHTDYQRLDACGPVEPSADSSACAQTFSTQVCTFSSVDRACNGFAVRGEYQLAVAPTCTANLMVFRFFGGDTLPALAVADFTVRMRNPAKQPGLLESFWTVEQFDAKMALRSSGAVRSWRVIPLLGEAAVRLAGPLRGSGSRTNLSLSFVPTSDAEEVELVALGPQGFDFTGATVEGEGRDAVATTAGSVRIRMAVAAGVRIDPAIAISGVGLPGPGPTEFVVRTFLAGVKADEEPSVSGASAFVVPGRINVTSQRLRTLYALDPNSSTTRSELSPRANDSAFAEFTLKLSAPVDEGDALRIEAHPFTFTEGGFVELALGDAPETGLNLSVLEHGDRLLVQFLSPLPAASELLVRAVVRTGPRVANGERWLFEIWRAGDDASADGALPAGTNDALASAFELVRTTGISLITGRVAPRSDVDVELVIDPGGAHPTQLQLIAPPGYIFPDGSCLSYEVTTSGKVLACRRLLNRANGVELQFAGEGLQIATKTTVTVRAPDRQEDAGRNMWLAKAILQGKEVGWGEAKGFQIVQMEYAQVIFGGSPAVKAHMAVIFRTTQTLLSGGYVELKSPEVYKFSCRPADGFSALSVPDVQQCDDTGNGVVLVLNATMSPSEYAFTVGVTNPSTTPAENVFSVLVSNAERQVVDARMHFEGPRIVSGLYLRPLELQYNSTEAMEEATIQITFGVHTDLDPLSPMGGVRALQMAAPERITLITRFGVGNLDGLPTPESGWAQLYYTERLVRVVLARSLSEEPPVIEAGRYRLSFQVRLPEFWMPNVNIWLLSLCRDLACTDLLATLAVAGFDLGDAPNLAVTADGKPSDLPGRAPDGRRPSAAAMLAAALLVAQAYCAT